MSDLLNWGATAGLAAAPGLLPFHGGFGGFGGYNPWGYSCDAACREAKRKAAEKQRKYLEEQRKYFEKQQQEQRKQYQQLRKKFYKEHGFYPANHYNPTFTSFWG